MFAKILTETGRKCEKIKIFFIESYFSQLEKDPLHPIFLFPHVLTDKCKRRKSFSNCETYIYIHSHIFFHFLSKSLQTDIAIEKGSSVKDLVSRMVSKTPGPSYGIKGIFH